MDSSKYKNSFEQISNEISDELNINNFIVDIDFSKLIFCDTYEKCDQIIISNLLSKLDNNSINSDEMVDIITTREHTFWFENYKNIYKALLSASKIIDFVKNIKLKIDSFEDGIKEYASHWYKADRYYRDYSIYSSKAEYLELLKTLNSKIEDIYLNSYLRKLNDYWQNFAVNYTTHTQILHQQKFYTTQIEQYIQ